MPGLVDVVAKIVGLWPLEVSYLKETGHKDDGDSHGVRSSIVGVLFASFEGTHYCLAVQKKVMDGDLYHNQLARMKFRPFHLFFGKLQVSLSHSQYDTCWYVVVPDQFLENFFQRTAIVPYCFPVSLSVAFSCVIANCG